jgi:uncharacterized protein with FMN-binding domain
MKRAPMVIGGTIAGLAAVLTFHTRSASPTLGSLPGISSTPGTTTSSPSSTSTTTIPAGSTNPASTVPTTQPSTTPPSTAPPSTTRRAVGANVAYNYGTMSVSVTVTGKRITKVGIASLDDGGSFRSQSIDQQSIPMLEQQALQAQSAKIQGVSGASYTSAGFQKSLQSALAKLGL